MSAIGHVIKNVTHWSRNSSIISTAIHIVQLIMMKAEWDTCLCLGVGDFEKSIV